MQIVIDIDEETLQDFYDSRYVSPHIKEALRNGTPLPKGHGNLIDKSNLLTVTDYDGENEKTYVLYEEIENAPIIIEANKESEG